MNILIGLALVIIVIVLCVQVLALWAIASQILQVQQDILGLRQTVIDLGGVIETEIAKPKPGPFGPVK